MIIYKNVHFTSLHFLNALVQSELNIKDIKTTLHLVFLMNLKWKGMCYLVIFS